jgi:hypothetical protein
MSESSRTKGKYTENTLEKSAPLRGPTAKHAKENNQGENTDNHLKIVLMSKILGGLCPCHKIPRVRRTLFEAPLE